MVTHIAVSYSLRHTHLHTKHSFMIDSVLLNPILLSTPSFDSLLSFLLSLHMFCNLMQKWHSLRLPSLFLFSFPSQRSSLPQCIITCANVALITAHFCGQKKTNKKINFWWNKIFQQRQMTQYHLGFEKSLWLIIILSPGSHQ